MDQLRTWLIGPTDSQCDTKHELLSYNMKIQMRKIIPRIHQQHP